MEEFTDPRWQGLDRPIKNDYGALLNLSSNEIRHPSAARLYVDFVRGFDWSRIAKYPYWPDMQDTVAAAAGCAGSQVTVTSGSDEGIRIILGMMGRPDREVVLQSPNYEGYEYYSRLGGMNVRRAAWTGRDPEDDFRTLLSLVRTSGKNLVAIANPHGVTGTALAMGEIGKLAACCLEAGSILIIDEAYAGMADLDHLPLIRDFPNIVIVRSYSKTLGMAGLRLGAILASPGISSILGKWRAEHSVSTVAYEYFKFCQARREEIKSMFADMAIVKEWTAKSLLDLHPEWAIGKTVTNFLLVETASDEEARNAYARARQGGFAIKTFQGEASLRGHFRITIADKSCMSAFLDVIGTPQLAKTA